MMMWRERDQGWAVSLVAWLLAAAMAAVGVGCASDGDRPVVAVDRWNESGSPYGRVSLSEEHVAEGLRVVLAELAREHGPLDVQGLCNDYAPTIRAELAQSGVGRIRRLRINDATVDIVVSFRVDTGPGWLVAEAFFNGESRAALRTVNRYSVVRR